jgi:hypothetical protein
MDSIDYSKGVDLSIYMTVDGEKVTNANDHNITSLDSRRPTRDGAALELNEWTGMPYNDARMLMRGMAIAVRSSRPSPVTKVCTNVPPGWALDFVRTMERYGVSTIVEKPVTPASGKPSIPVQHLVDKAVAENKIRMSELERKIDDMKLTIAHREEMLENLRNKISNMQTEVYRVHRALSRGSDMLAPDPNDPSVTLVRPTRLMEMRVMGKLTSDIKTIVIQIPSDKAFQKMLTRMHREIQRDRQGGHIHDAYAESCLNASHAMREASVVIMNAKRAANAGSKIDPSRRTSGLLRSLHNTVQYTRRANMAYNRRIGYLTGREFKSSDHIW